MLRRIWWEIAWRLAPRKEYVLVVKPGDNMVILDFTEREAQVLRDAGAVIWETVACCSKA